MSVLPSPEAMVVVILFAYTAHMLSKTFAWDEQFDSLIKARDRIMELQAENAKLRKRIGELEKLTDGKLYIPQEWYAQLKAENAKLREFALELWDAASHPTTFGDGSYLRSQMRELGIEVDE